MKPLKNKISITLDSDIIEILKKEAEKSSPASFNAVSESGASSTIVPSPCHGLSLTLNIVSTSAAILIFSSHHFLFSFFCFDSCLPFTNCTTSQIRTTVSTNCCTKDFFFISSPSFFFYGFRRIIYQWKSVQNGTSLFIPV